MVPWRALPALLVAALLVLLAPRLVPTQRSGKAPFGGGRLLPGSDLWFATLFQLTNPIEGGRLQFRPRALGFAQGSVSFTLSAPAALITFARADSANGVLPSGGRWLIPLPLSFNETSFPDGFAWDARTNLPAGLWRSREGGVLVVVGGRVGKSARARQ